MDQTPFSPPASPCSLPPPLLYPSPRAHMTSLAQESRLRWKEKNDSLLDKSAFTKCGKKKIDPDRIQQPPSSPWPKALS